jgi:large subunit ribosomal protein L15
MQLHDVSQGIHRRKKRKRVGRGVGSGHGKTAGKGHKGHSSRQGFKIGALFEGGQITLARRVPKRGFVNGAFKKFFATVNLVDLDAVFTQAGVVDEAALRAVGLVKGYDHDGIKILADGEVTKAFEVRATKFSAAAVQKIEAAGGKVVVVPYVGKVKKDEQADTASQS